MEARACFAIAVTAIAVAGCADEQPAARRIEVTKVAWLTGTGKGPWPFTVDQGVLTCRAPEWATFTANGTEYALTDDARWLGHYQDVSAILVEGLIQIGDERQPVPTSYRAMADRAEALCP